MITKAQLLQITPNVNANMAALLAKLINDGIAKYKLPLGALPEFIANIAHESGGFRLRKESLLYTRPERLIAVWTTRFGVGKRDPNQYINNSVKLANFVYGGRMGNVQPNDGSTFVGGGFAQITGRDAYTMYHRFSKRAGTVQDTAKWVQDTDEGAMDSAFWFFCEYKNLEEMGVQDNFRLLVSRWNGGLIGMPDRIKYLERARQVLGVQ